MSTIFYRKVGRRYKPVYEYDQDLMDSFPHGAHIVMCYPGGQSRRFNIDPAFGPMIAAGRYAEDAIGTAITQATELQPPRAPKEMTPEQVAAWNHLIEVFGEDARQLKWASIRDCAEAGVNAMQQEADKLLKHPAVRQAWDQFMLVCKLTQQGETK